MRTHDLILDGARRHPDRPAVTWVDRGRTLTYADAAQAMDPMAGALSGWASSPAIA